MSSIIIVHVLSVQVLFVNQYGCSCLSVCVHACACVMVGDNCQLYKHIFFSFSLVFSTVVMN